MIEKMWFRLVGKAGSNRAGILVLVQRPVAILHAVGGVHQHRAAKIRILLELLDVKPVLAGPDLPVNMTQVVSHHVLAVLEELNRLAKIGTAVHPGKESFHDVPRPQIQAADAFNRLRMQKSFGIGHRWSVRLPWSGCRLKVVQ